MLKKLIYLCFSIVLFFACGDETIDSCVGVDCGVSGECLDGTCDCEDGYFGDNCELLIQDRFVGTWSGLDCDGDIFNLIIESGSTAVTLIINEQLFDINANIIDENNFYVPEQFFFVVILGINITVIGAGKILENSMLEFDASIAADGEDPESCISVLEKQ